MKLRRYRVLVLYPCIILLVISFYLISKQRRPENVSVPLKSSNDGISNERNIGKIDQGSSAIHKNIGGKDEDEIVTKETRERAQQAQEEAQAILEKELQEKSQDEKSPPRIYDPNKEEEASDVNDADIGVDTTEGNDQDSEENQGDVTFIDIELPEDIASTNEESDESKKQNFLNGTTLDNNQKTNPNPAPIPLYNKNLMTDQYVPYEQIRVVKDTHYYDSLPDGQAPHDNLVNATLVVLVRNEELYTMLSSIAQFEDRFNKNYHYDWVFLNDRPFTDDFIDYTSNLVSGTARYGVIPHEHWSYPPHIDQKIAKEVRDSSTMKNVAYGDSESYRHMCRYNSGFFYKHPIVEEYQYYWRVEPDVSYSCDIPYDPFKFMIRKKKKYGFTISMLEFPKTITTLWSTSLQYFKDEKNIKKYNFPSDDESLIHYLSNDGGYSYNLCHFWSNFEIADLDIYRNEAYENYFHHLDHAGGFFYERWGDAPIHSIAFGLMLKKEDFHVFQDIAYKHTVAGTCPHDDAMRKRLRCVCNPEEDWTWTSESSCNPSFVKFVDAPTLKDHQKYMDIKEQKQMEEARIIRENLKAKRKAIKERSEQRRKIAEERRKKKAQSVAAGKISKQLSKGSRSKATGNKR